MAAGRLVFKILQEVLASAGGEEKVTDQEGRNKSPQCTGDMNVLQKLQENPQRNH